MKKMFVLISIILVIMSSTVIAAENDIVASISPFKVKVNESGYIENNTYPSLFYNNVVYIPMTYNVGEFLGMTIEWVDGYDQKVLLLTKKEKREVIETDNVKEYGVEKKPVKANVSDCTIAVCKGENLDLVRGTKEYPLLMYKDIIYIPLTWDNIVEKLEWKYSFDEANVMNIETSQSITNENDEKDIYISNDGSTTSYILERKKYVNEDGLEKTDYIGLIRYNYDMVGQELTCYNMSDFIIERELSRPVQQGDLRFFKSYNNDEGFFSPVRENLWKFVHSATTSMLDVRTGSINKWQSSPSWRQDVIVDNELGITSISMTGTDYVSDGVTIINFEDSDIVLKSIPMQYVIKRVDEGRNEIILTYDVPQFPGGSIIVPAPTSTISKLHFSLPPWDFRDVNGNYVPEGEYEISLVVPDKVEYVVNGKTVSNENPKGVFINSKIKLVK